MKSIYDISDEGPLRIKTRDFALRIVRLYKYLTTNYKEFVLSKQILRSGTSIGANVAEAIYGQSKKDFVAKLTISLKETSETIYWLDLLYQSDFINKKEFNSMLADAEEIRKILISSINTSRKSLEKQQ